MINKAVLGPDFPWYYQPISTTEKFPFFSHGLIQRYDHVKEEPQSNSRTLPVFMDILQRFCSSHKIKVKKITRACLNLVQYRGQKYKTTDPHVDHEFKHKVFMVYLTNSTGSTLIFDSTYKKNQNKKSKSLTKFKILKEIKPEAGKAVCWDGKQYHAACFPKPGTRRVVLVMTFI